MKILVDPKAVLFLLGTEMDYKADKMQAQFIFNNPNQTRRLRLRRVGAADGREDLVSCPGRAAACVRGDAQHRPAPLLRRPGHHGYACTRWAPAQQRIALTLRCVRGTRCRWTAIS